MDRKKIFFVTLLSAIALCLFVVGIFWLLVLTVNSNYNVYWIIVICGLYLLNAVTSFYILNSASRITDVKLCWIFVVSAFPLFGVFAFYIFGIIPFKKQNYLQIKQKNEKFLQHENYDFTNKIINSKKRNYCEFLYTYNLEGNPIYENNKVQMISQEDLYKESVKLIRSAKEFIHIQFYIISDCVWYFLLMNELVKKAKEGIKIKLMYDWVGSHKRFNKKSFKYLKSFGIEITEFNPKTFIRFTSITNFRSHRKCIIIDNQKCITGGSNIGDEYINLKRKYDNWKDINFLIEGEIVNSINLRFCNDWINYSNYKNTKNNEFYKNYKIHKVENNDICQLINSSPELNFSNYQTIIASKISRAKKRVWIYTPYLLIPEEIKNQLMCSAIKGVDVRIIVPNLPDDKKFILTTNRNTYGPLLEANIKIYEYCGFLHAKAIIIDDDEAIVGSNNMDFRSLIINFETSIVIRSKKFSLAIRKEYEKDITNSIAINEKFLKRKYNIFSKLAMGFIKIIYPLL